MRLVALLFTAASLYAQPQVIKLWPATQAKDTEVTELGADGEHRTRDVNTPTITAHIPEASKANGTAVIIAPGGGYSTLAVDKEGNDVARFLTSHGVAGIMLKYRVMPSTTTREDRAKALPRIFLPYAQQPEFAHLALDDLRQAFRLVQQNAKEWHIDPACIGVLGFSAGGHLILNLALNPTPEIHPAFYVPLYAAAPAAVEYPSGTAPVFLLHAADDPTVPVAGAYTTLSALNKSKVPTEAHIFRDGGHGFGIRKKGKSIDQWPELLRAWLQANGWLTTTRNPL